MALRREIVDLGRPDLLHQPDQIGRIRHVAVVQQERHVAGVRIFIEMVDARGVERGRPPLDAVHGVAEAEQIFGEIGAVLAGDAGNQRNAPFRILNRHSSPTTPGLSEYHPRAVGRRQTAKHCAGPASSSRSDGRKPGGQPLSCPPSPKQIGPGKTVTGSASPGLRVMEPWLTIKYMRGDGRMVRNSAISASVQQYPRKANKGRNGMRKLMMAAAFALPMLAALRDGAGDASRSAISIRCRAAAPASAKSA